MLHIMLLTRKKISWKLFFRILWRLESLKHLVKLEIFFIVLFFSIECIFGE